MPEYYGSLLPERRIARLDSATVARKFKQRIVRQYTVRFHMSLILAATTAAGLISSKLLLEAGLASVLMRYPLAVVCAYFVFLGLTRLWVAYVLIGRPSKHSWNWVGDVGPVDVDLAGSPAGGTGGVQFGGGDSGGGGASASWGVAETPSDSGGAALPDIDLSVDLDDGIWILVVLALLVLAIFGAGGYLIYAAPNILPDVALNALLASCLTGAARRAETNGWVYSILRSTWIPLMLILIVTVALAVVVHRHCPGAPKLMDALACPATMEK